MKVTFLLLFISLLAACSSNQRKGDDMMAAEQYDQAVFYYEKAYHNNPDDEEITQKLSFSRSRLVAANLIKVRMFRQSNLQIKAAKKLNESLEQMQRWRVHADSAVKSTIDEEVQFAGVWLNANLANLAKQKNYNRFSYSIKQYNHIIDSGLTQKIIARQKPVMNTLGQKQCHRMQQALTPQSSFYYSVWRAYCANFDKAVDYKLGVDPSRFTMPHINSRQLKIDRAVGASVSIFTAALSQQIQDHLWFSSRGKRPLSLMLKGDVRYKKVTTPHVFSFTYPAKKSTYELIKDKTNPKIVKRTLLHETPIERTVNVQGKRHKETVSHNLLLKAKLHSYPVDGSELSVTRSHQTYSHQATFDKKKVRPLIAKYMKKNEWFSTIGRSTLKQLRADLDKAWIDSFCQGNSPIKLPKYERAARCAQLKAGHPVVAGWTQDQFGLSHAELLILLK